MSLASLLGALGGKPTSTSHEIGVLELKRRMDAGEAVVVDVRTLGEVQSERVPGMIHIPLDELPHRLGELDAYRDGEVLLMCRSGGRSARATALLADNGFHAVNVHGGLLAWYAAGLPVER